MKIKVTNLFPAVARISFPDADKPGVVKKIEFTCRFEALSNEPGIRDEMQRLQKEQGLYAFLDKVLKAVEFKQQGDPIEFEDANGEPLTQLEGVKQSAIFGAGAALAYWDVINRDTDAKNSKR